MSVMQNTILMAVPLFIFMGIVLQKTKLAEQLLEAMGDLFGNVRTISNNKVVPNMTKPII
jgi:TRAP-type mannitol/chloroaromatic compound transport system permease large subunit